MSGQPPRRSLSDRERDGKLGRSTCINTESKRKDQRKQVVQSWYSSSTRTLVMLMGDRVEGEEQQMIVFNVGPTPPGASSAATRAGDGDDVCLALALALAPSSIVIALFYLAPPPLLLPPPMWGPPMPKGYGLVIVIQ